MSAFLSNNKESNMVKTVMLNKQTQEKGSRLAEFVNGDQFELYLNIEDYQELEKVIHTLFDESSVERIKKALKTSR
jgi:hypothetical protein